MSLMQSTLSKEKTEPLLNSGHRKRLIGLDIFRILLAVEIFMFHSNGHLKCSYGRVINALLRRFGATTMTAFFILSGYLIWYVHEKDDFSKIRTIKSFYIKRLIAILPAYYFVAVLFIIFLRKDTWSDQFALFPIELMGLQSTFSSLFNFSHNNGTWFVSCILVCYLVFPLIHIVVKQLSEKSRYIIFGVSAFILLYSPVITQIFKIQATYTSPFFRALEFLLGVLFASFEESWSVKKTSFKTKILSISGILWIGCSLLLVWYIRKNGFPSGFMLYSVFFLPIWFLIIVLMKKISINSPSITKIIIFFSNTAYALFLVQFFVWPLQRVIEEFIVLPNILRIVSSFVICICFAVIVHLIVEKPVQKLFKRRKKYESA